MRCEVTFTTDTVSENQLTLKRNTGWFPRSGEDF